MQSFIRELRDIENWFTQSRATHNGDDYSFGYIVLMGMLVTFIWMKCYLKKATVAHWQLQLFGGVK